MSSSSVCGLAVLLALSGPARSVLAQGSITTPREQLGHNLGDDYFLANYEQLTEYWRKLDSESDRLRVVGIGPTEEGREMLMAIVTSPENHRDLEHYRQISRRLAMAEGVDEAEARELAREGRAVVWIDGGLHASEVLVAQQLMEQLYQLVSMNDEETLRFLDDLVILLCNPNPDGQDLVADWYMRNEDKEKRSSRGIPRLYQKYIGHDNNRDFYMITQKETEAICRIFYHEWSPQIVYNHHQTGPSGTVLFAPPFRDPFNYNCDPLVPLGIDLVGASMHGRFVVEGKPGATMRSGASYSTWWNGGLRTNVYFHNMIGLLTETIGSPTPMEIPLRLSRQLRSGDLPMPITPQKWHFRQSVEYSITANRAVMDVASRHREQFLFNAWRMGMNSIERGSRDHWTVWPERVAAAEVAQREEAERAAAERQARPQDSEAQEEGPPRRERGSDQESERPDIFKDVLRDPAHRDPRGFILPSDQPDFSTATKFVNTLIKGGVQVLRAKGWFEVAGVKYPPGSYVVKTAQAYRPHILDMFEPQNYPDDIPYPGGAPIPPYDSAGWTVAFQMGIVFDRILEGFDGPFEKIEGFASTPPGAVTPAESPAGYLLSHQTNDSFVAINRLLASGESVKWLTEEIIEEGGGVPAGAFFIPNKSSTPPMVRELARDLGLDFHAVEERPQAHGLSLDKPRIGLWDRYGGSMASGWTRWLLERFEFDFDLVFAPELDAGNLAARYDVLIFVSGGIPRAGGGGGRRRGGRGAPDKESIPEEYHDQLGSVTADKTIPQLKAFLEAGGTVVTIGSSTALAAHLDLPISNPLVELQQDGSEQRLGREKYYVPGSVLSARVDTTHPLAAGLGEDLDVYFNNSPVFRLKPGAALKGVHPVAWFEGDEVLRSGWAWGEHYLRDTVAIAEARVGMGTLYLFGPEITFRAQPHGTFKFLFNAIHFGAARRPRAY